MDRIGESTKYGLELVPNALVADLKADGHFMAADAMYQQVQKGSFFKSEFGNCRRQPIVALPIASSGPGVSRAVSWSGVRIADICATS